MRKKELQRVSIRCTRYDDRSKILSILKETNFFRPEELRVAEEVLDTALAEGNNGHYQSFVAEENGIAVGWICFGPTPCTVGTFDIYWLVVAPQKQRNGVGAYLMKYAADLIKNRSGRMIVAETSGNSHYRPTQRFYEKIDYRQAGCIKDFYAVGDDKIIYVKTI